MATSASGPRPVSASELEAQQQARRAGTPFLLLRDGDGVQRIVTLDTSRSELWIGRAFSVDVQLGWDPEVSALHAQLERAVEEEWTLIDDGLSRNGSYVNGERVQGRRRLRDGDTLRFGHTLILYCSGPEETQATVVSG